MSEFQPSYQNGTPGLFNRSWSGWHHYQVLGAAETVILPSLTGIICITGLVGNILIVFTIVRTQRKTIPDTYICNLAIADLVHIVGMPFLTHQWARGGEWVFGSPLCTIITSLDTCNQFTCSAIVTTMSLDRYMLHLTITTLFSFTTDIYLLYFNFMLYMGDVSAKQASTKESSFYLFCSYTTSIPRQRILRLTKTVLALVSVSVVSAAPFHVIQLMNLQVSQPTLTFCVSYYISICPSYTSSSINPFLYILLSGIFRKHLRRCTNVEVRMADQDANVSEKTLKSSC